MKERIKKPATIAAVALLMLFGMNRCAVSCRYSGELRKTEAAIDSLTRTRDSLKTRIELLENDTAMLRNVNRDLGQSNDRLLDKVSNKEIHHWHKK